MLNDVEKESNGSNEKKLATVTAFIKNVKFLALTIIVLVVLGVAIISGDGKYIVVNLYKNVTGQKYQTFSPVQDYSNATYIILRDTLSRDTNIQFKNAEITLFKESDTSHRYRVELKDEIRFYNVKQKQNGIWQINKE